MSLTFMGYLSSFNRGSRTGKWNEVKRQQVVTVNRIALRLIGSLVVTLNLALVLSLIYTDRLQTLHGLFHWMKFICSAGLIPRVLLLFTSQSRTWSSPVGEVSEAKLRAWLVTTWSSTKPSATQPMYTFVTLVYDILFEMKSMVKTKMNDSNEG